MSPSPATSQTLSYSLTSVLTVAAREVTWEQPPVVPLVAFAAVKGSLPPLVVRFTPFASVWLATGGSLGLGMVGLDEAGHVRACTPAQKVKLDGIQVEAADAATAPTGPSCRPAISPSGRPPSC